MPTPVYVTNPDTAAIVAAIAASAAAIIALIDIAITLRTFARKSSLRARFDYATSDYRWTSDGEYIYRIGCSVMNGGNKGLSDFRSTFYLSPGCRIDSVESNYRVEVGGPHNVYGPGWSAAEISAGRIYARDDLFVGNVVIVATPGSYDACWVIRSEDERVPSDGFSKKERLTLPAPHAVEATTNPSPPPALGPAEIRPLEAALKNEERHAQREEQIENDKPSLTATAEVIGPDEHRRRGYSPPSNQWQLVVIAHNAGPGIATDVRIEMNSGRFADRVEQIGPIAVGGESIPWRDFVDMDTSGMPSTTTLPATIAITYAGRGWVNGVIELTGSGAPTRYRVTRNTPPTRV